MSTIPSMIPRMKRVRRQIKGLILCPCHFTFHGQLEGAAHFVTLDAAHLANLYPARMFEYAVAGDYVGRVRREDSTEVVDFHVTPSHDVLCRAAWRARVVDIARVIKVL